MGVVAAGSVAPDGRAAEAGQEISPEIGEILLTPEQIRVRVGELAAEISRDYQGRDLHLVCVLRGAWIFAADLVRQLSIPASIDFIAISSYGAGTRSTGVVRIVKDLEDTVESRYVRTRNGQAEERRGRTWQE